MREDLGLERRTSLKIAQIDASLEILRDEHQVYTDLDEFFRQELLAAPGDEPHTRAKLLRRERVRVIGLQGQWASRIADLERRRAALQQRLASLELAD